MSRTNWLIKNLAIRTGNPSRIGVKYSNKIHFCIAQFRSIEKEQAGYFAKKYCGQKLIPCFQPVAFTSKLWSLVVEK